MPQSQTAETDAKDTVITDTTNATKPKITKEMIMYVEMGEETETEYQVNFRSYTGAFVYFHVDKATGKTRMVEHVPNLNITEEAGSIDLLEYLKD